MLLAASIVLWLLGETQERATVSGVVRDELGQVLPGVTVTLDSTERVGQSVTDDKGVYRLVDVPPGRYALRATLPGFLAEGRSLDVSSSGAVSDLTLRIGPAAEVLHVVPPPREAVRQADTIAHIRLRRRFDRRPCDGPGVVSTLFDADVLAAFKGAAPATLQMYQDGAGQCVANGTAYAGLAERPYTPGTELIVFLTFDGERYHRVAGGMFAFAVQRGIVETREWHALPDRVTIETFRQAVRQLIQ